MPCHSGMPLVATSHRPAAVALDAGRGALADGDPPRVGRRRSSAREGRASATTRPTRRCCWRRSSRRRRATSPTELGEALSASWATRLERVEVAGPGFLNLFLADAWFAEALARRARRRATASAAAAAAAAERVDVEFVSANPTGPLHVGHARNAAYGDALARMLALPRPRRHARVLRQRLRLPGRALRRVDAGPRARRGGRPRAATRASTSSSWRRCDRRRRQARPRRARSAGVAVMLERIRGDAERFRRRASTSGSRSARCTRAPTGRRTSLQALRCASRAADLRARRRPVAAHDELRRRQGPRARALDRRAHVLRVRHRLHAGQARARLRPPALRARRRPPRLLARHEGGLRRRSAATATARAADHAVRPPASRAATALDVQARPASSSRSTTCVDEIGVDAARWYLLQRSHDTTIDLDLELAERESAENPVYYVQYAHARIASMLAQGGRATRAAAALARRAPAPALRAGRAGADQAAAGLPGRGGRGGRSAARRTGSPPTRSSSRRTSPPSTATAGSSVQPEPLEAFRLALCVATQADDRRGAGLLGVSAPRRDVAASARPSE